MFADRGKPNPWSRSAPLPRDQWPNRPAAPRLSTGQVIKQTTRRAGFVLLGCLLLLGAGMALAPKLDQMELARREWRNIR